FVKVSSSEEQLTVSWQLPASNGGCAVTGYLIQMEDINSPGYLTVYNGVQQSTRTQITLTYPQV
ncbi:MAG: fibronectin type III domain-containing protein, partial [Candidatus Nitrosotenuis sp.]